MDLMHATVRHQTFGQGEIVQLSNDVVSVSFENHPDKKKFLYPGAFHEHLTLQNESLHTEMAELLKQNNILVAAEQQRVERADRIAQFRADSIEKANVSAKSKKKKK